MILTSLFFKEVISKQKEVICSATARK